MHIKHMHEMNEKLAEYGKRMVDEGTGNGKVNLEEVKCVIEMIEKLSEAEYHARISKAMEEADEEEKEEIKYIIKKMKEEGEDWNEDDARRFYRGQPRSKTSGRYMSRGDGRRSRGYEEPMYYGGMMPEIYNPMEYYRDMDRMDGKMYYSGGQSSGGNSGGQSGQSNGGSSSSMSGNMSGNTRGYSDGYNDGLRDGKGMESRYDKAKRGYEEAKKAHNGNTPEDKQLTMRETEKMINVVLDELEEMVDGASPEVKSLVKTKGMARLQKIQ